MYIDGNPILQVVDEGTSFQAARWLKNMTAAHTWDTLRYCWIDIYSGPPETIIHDAGTYFDSSEFRGNALGMAIKVKCIPVESPQSIGLVERYHTPLRRAYSIITDELKGQPCTAEIRLQMAVKAVNDTAGYDGLVPTLLVFGTYPRISNIDAPTLSTVERARSINHQTDEITHDPPPHDHQPALTDFSNHDSSTSNVPRQNPSRNRRLPGRYNIPDIELYIFEPNFKTSRLVELNGLLEREVFKILSRHNVPTNTRIFGSRFVDQIKNEGTKKAFEKSRLVVQAYNDADKKNILTQAPTIQRVSQRLILILSLIFDLPLYTRDISQAYNQSNSKLARDIFINAPAEMNLPQHTILKVVLPLYGTPESGTHWFKTYHTRHTEKLGMTSSTFDECLLFKSDMSAVIGLQTDNSLIAVTLDFMKIEAQELKTAGLIAKPCEKLTADHALEFNGFKSTLVDSHGLMITQN
ncbi:hypothetical protein K3495_g11667 [Podosphaera aphanis]|nr:hypothetical protein K3495_g11667 [Podosphaera aphanis]